jgi:hypothetical protein
MLLDRSLATRASARTVCNSPQVCGPKPTATAAQALAYSGIVHSDMQLPNRVTVANQRQSPNRFRKPYWFATATLFLSLASAIAAAQPTASERETARNAMDEGDRLRSAGDLQAALVRYRAAHELMRVPTTGIEVARTQAQLGLLVEARSSAIDTANLPVDAAEPGVFGEARKAAAQLAAELGPKVPSITTVVRPTGLGYTLTIDGVKLPSQARTLAFKTDPGEHEIAVRAPGYKPAVEQVLLKEGEQQTLELTLELDAAGAPAPVAAAAASTIKPASAAIEAEPESAEASSRDAGRLRGYIGLGVGGAVFTAGAITGIMSLVQTHDVKRECTGDMCPVSAKQRLDRANTLANVANVAIPLGLIGIAYGVYELLTLPAAEPASASARSDFQVQVSARGAYAVWQGTL